MNQSTFSYSKYKLTGTRLVPRRLTLVLRQQAALRAGDAPVMTVLGPRPAGLEEAPSSCLHPRPVQALFVLRTRPATLGSAPAGRGGPLTV